MAVTTGVVELVKCTTSGTPETHPVPWNFESFTMSQYDILAPMIQIVWKSTDIPHGALPPNVAASATPAPGTGIATPSAAPTGIAAASGRGHLSNGALAGVVVGVVIGVIGIGLVVFWWWRRRNKQPRHTRIPSPSKGDGEDWGSDLAIATNGFWTDGGAYGAPDFAHRGYYAVGSEKTLATRMATSAENLNSGTHQQSSGIRQEREFEMTVSDPFYDPQREANLKFAGMPPEIWGRREDSPGPSRLPAGRGS
ncbi:hypothetical protein Micbo1qcDRAFT_156120 [Microdochium bolleyi]|uniref:Uncharacterized protein n=1 Tax=Microdochium bolleyi TaxID=196109 RepID=A0A136JJF7_9PEZI|nr:hypothetical protein Micbo1qcDRAFT_156120 [Microdochium bolleyi]